jgi:hypothetical protein
MSPQVLPGGKNMQLRSIESSIFQFMSGVYKSSVFLLKMKLELRQMRYNYWLTATLAFTSLLGGGANSLDYKIF